jgi:hypothetical protein
MRKIEYLSKLKQLGLNTAMVREFKAHELNNMIQFANELINKHGSFNVRTDLNPAVEGKAINLPFIKDCTISKLIKLVNDNGNKLTYLVQQGINDEDLIFNGVLRLCDGIVIGEINEIDKTSLRNAMKITQNIKKVMNAGNDELFNKIKSDLMRIDFDGWVELSAYEDGTILYWQIVPEKMTEHLKQQFFKQ